MASDSFKGREKARFPALFVFGLLRAAAVIIVAAIALGGEFAIPIAVLVAIVAAAGIGYRLISGSNRSAESDAADSGLPKTGQDRTRPLGDTPDAHDEVNPHDLPLSNPGRHEAERLASGSEGTTAGHSEGGAAGRGGPSGD